ncbi:MAG: PLP-dependent lyase/thiolase [Actinomycetota bacterium]
MAADETSNPLLRYRHRLAAHQRALAGGIDDARFVEMVTAFDDAVAGVWGHGFRTSPVVDGTAVARAAGLDFIDEVGSALWIKDETGTVGASHKARHLAGVALDLLVGRELGSPLPDRLAIASCGNAAIAASVIARAIDRPLDVYVPLWADDTVLGELARFGATVHRCERRDGEPGDPCYLRFTDAVADGRHAFSVQGTDTPTTFDAARTIGWELLDQVGPLDRLYVQVGGGALATAVGDAVGASLHPVQADGCAPLDRAWSLVGPDGDLAAAAADAERYMWPWDDPASAATGILDDVTYDWVPLLQTVQHTGGHTVVAPEENVLAAHALARATTTVPVCITGTAGLAGLMTDPPTGPARVAVLFTGLDRHTA